MEEFMSEQTPTAEAAALNSTANPVGIDGYFGISERGSTIPTEILAGLSTFLALSYILVVNPAILAQAGILTAVSPFPTIAISGAAPLLIGPWALLPVAVSPALQIHCDFCLP